MARPLRIEFPGALYHVLSRGNDKGVVFIDDADCADFLSRLRRVAERLRWRIWAYCLMPNHYHAVVETLDPSLARGMRDVNGAYSQAFNRRHDRVGHVFQGRYKSLLVDKESYLLELTRYIVLNPVRAGLCSAADQWRWSSHRAVMGTADQGPRVAGQDLLHFFDADPATARRRYAAFVAAGVEAADPRSEVRNEVFLGDTRFVAAATRGTAAPSTEVPRAQRAWTPLAHYAHAGHSRNESIREAYASGAYTLAAIARHFGLHYTTVSRIAKGSRCDNTRPDPND